MLICISPAVDMRNEALRSQHCCLVETIPLLTVASKGLEHRPAAAEAVPKRILDLMNVEGLTRENVASHLQASLSTSYTGVSVCGQAPATSQPCLALLTS